MPWHEWGHHQNHAHNLRCALQMQCQNKLSTTTHHGCHAKEDCCMAADIYDSVQQSEPHHKK